ncbi:hypothetical protein ACFL5H_01280 [Candidatus Latescibacterota bacterium]
MKASRVVLIALLVAGIGGCSIMEKTPPQVDVVGNWSGKSHDGSSATMIFHKEKSVSISITVEDYDIYMVGKYEVDYTTDPVTVDLRDLDLSEFGMVLYCQGIVAFPEPRRMIFYGQLGESSGATSPTEFNPNPSQMGELYLELTKD